MELNLIPEDGLHPSLIPKSIKRPKMTRGPKPKSKEWHVAQSLFDILNVGQKCKVEVENPKYVSIYYNRLAQQEAFDKKLDYPRQLKMTFESEGVYYFYRTK